MGECCPLFYKASGAGMHCDPFGIDKRWLSREKATERTVSETRGAPRLDHNLFETRLWTVASFVSALAIQVGSCSYGGTSLTRNSPPPPRTTM